MLSSIDTKSLHCFRWNAVQVFHPGCVEFLHGSVAWYFVCRWLCASFYLVYVVFCIKELAKSNPGLVVARQGRVPQAGDLASGCCQNKQSLRAWLSARARCNSFLIDQMWHYIPIDKASTAARGRGGVNITDVKVAISFYSLSLCVTLPVMLLNGGFLVPFKMTVDDGGFFISPFLGKGALC